MCKTPKSKLFQVFESKNPDCIIEAVPPGCAVLLDAMAILQSLVTIPETFGELSRNFAKVVGLANKFEAFRVDFISDLNHELSIKNAEREKRANDSISNIRIYGREQKVF